MKSSEMRTPIDFTVAIVTYNGGDRLPAVLEKLRSQVGIEAIDWEILVIDNNSSDRTAEVIKNYQEDKNFPAEIRYSLESQQGAGFGRQRAIREARASLIGFLDDDNLPDATWIVAAVQFAQEHPKAGAYGSQIHGDYEIEPPPNFERIETFLAINERGDTPLLYSHQLRVLPPSAGLVVRQQVWLDYVPKSCVLSGRVPWNLIGGEDVEVLTYIQRSGAEIWYNPAMKIVHKIPSRRLTKEYLLALMEGNALCRYPNRMIGIQPWLQPFWVVFHFGKDILKIMLHLCKYGIINPSNKAQTIFACEREFLIKTCLSPLYFWLKIQPNKPS